LYVLVHHLRRGVSTTSTRYVFGGYAQNTSTTYLSSSKRFFSSDETVVPLPSLGDSISEGTLVEWHIAVGQAVAVDDVVAVVETDKVSVEIISPAAGVVTSLAFEEGDTMLVDDPIFTVSASAEATVTKSEASSPAAPVAATPAPAPAAPTPSPAPSTPAPSSSAAPHRIPSIKFRHGVRPEVLPSAEHVSDFSALEANELERPSYKREITQEEIDLIEMGGAEPY